MGRYWEVKTDHEGLAPVRDGCGASGRRERATRAGSANGRREWTARVGGASGRCSKVARKRWCADGTGGGIGKIPAQAPCHGGASSFIYVTCITETALYQQNGVPA